MNYITTTQLRTQVPAFVAALLAGKKITLIHRSKTLGIVALTPENSAKPFDGKRYLEETKNLESPRFTKKQLEKNYRDYIMGKYDKYLP